MPGEFATGATFRPAADAPTPETADALAEGQRIALGTVEFATAEIKAFARAFDPQDFHLDEAAAARSLFGGLTASGFHSLAALFGLQVRAGVFTRCNLGGRGMDEVRWLRPVRPGTPYLGSVTIRTIRPVPTKARAEVAVLYALEEKAGAPVLEAPVLEAPVLEAPVLEAPVLEAVVHHLMRWRGHP